MGVRLIDKGVMADFLELEWDDGDSDGDDRRGVSLVEGVRKAWMGERRSERRRGRTRKGVVVVVVVALLLLLLEAAIVISLVVAVWVVDKDV